MKKRILQDKSEAFSIRIVNMRKYLLETYRERELSSQVVRSGTSIGANIAEAFSAQSDADFIAKLYISLKESNETMHWLKTLYGAKYLTEIQFQSLSKDCHEIIGLLIHTIKKKKTSMSAARK